MVSSPECEAHQPTMSALPKPIHINWDAPWDRDQFYNVRMYFMNEPTEIKALDVLQRLVHVDPNDISQDDWLDCKTLILLLLQHVPMNNLLGSQQMLILLAVQDGPDKVCGAIAEFLYKSKSATQYLNTTAIAVAVALSRRIACDAYESIADVLAAVAGQPEVLGELEGQLSAADSESRFRVHQVTIAAIRDGTYTSAMTSLLEAWLRELEVSDVLVQMATVESMAELLIKSPQSYRILNGVQAPEKIYAIMQRSRDSPDGLFLFPKCNEFFGAMCRVFPSAINKYPEFISCLMNSVSYLDSLDALQRVQVVETFAMVAHTDEGKKAIEAMEGVDILRGVMASVERGMSTGPIDLRSRVMCVVALMLREGDSKLRTRWFSFLPHIQKMLSQYSLRPFPEMRLSTLSLLQSYLSLEVGWKAMVEDEREDKEQFVKWLFDSGSESDKNCRDAKLDLLGMLLQEGYPVEQYAFDRPLRPSHRVAVQEL